MRRTIRKPAAPVTKDKEFAAPLFKNSLLAWQARFKAQRGGQGTGAPRSSAPVRPA
jgi:hypothetical protein